VDKLFDLGQDQVSSNLGQLDVHESTSKAGIAGNLEALKKMRAKAAGGSGAAEPKAEAPKPAPKPPKPPAKTEDGLNGPEAEAAVANADTKRKISASMERLKAVREGERND
jgi:hypothetical protein